MSCPGNAPGDVIAYDWANRVVANGGARPAQATIDAAADFYDALRTAGIVSKMKAVNILAPDSLTAALTPIIKTLGVDPWVNRGPFVAGDLTVNGLKGNGTTKRVSLGINASTDLLQNDVGLSGYFSETPVGDLETLLGVNRPDGGSLWLSSGIFDCWNNGTERIQHSKDTAGFYSGSRRAANDSKAYFANGSQAFSQIGSTANGGTSKTFGDINAFAVGDSNAPPNALFLTNKRVSFLAIHLGLTSVESQALFNAVQALRTAFGGGFV